MGDNLESDLFRTKEEELTTPLYEFLAIQEQSQNDWSQEFYWPPIDLPYPQGQHNIVSGAGIDYGSSNLTPNGKNQHGGNCDNADSFGTGRDLVDLSASKLRRKEQNRAAQKAFRARKEDQLQASRNQTAILQTRLESAEVKISKLKAALDKAETQVETLQAALPVTAKLSNRARACTAGVGCGQDALALTLSLNLKPFLQSNTTLKDSWAPFSTLEDCDSSDSGIVLT